MGGVIGSAIKRREDPALIQGKGKFTDNLSLPGMQHASIVRSPYAHAKIRCIDTAAAKGMPGVIALFTGQDVEASPSGGVVPTAWLLPSLKTPPHPILATEIVRYVGEGVAVVVAESPYAARDAAEKVAVDYEPLDVVCDPVGAASEGAPQLFDEAPGNVAFEWELGELEPVEEAFRNTNNRVELTLRNNRTLPHPIEPRSALASYEDHTGELTLWMTSQNPHVHRLLMSLASIGLPEHRIRVVAGDVGGGFGCKIHHYPDEAIVSWCSMQLNLPVKWTATRTETNLTDAHGRDHVTTAALALSDYGRIQAFKVQTHAAMGAYLSTFAPAVPTYLYGTLLSGQYDMPAIHVSVKGVFTNTAPVDAVRGAGRPEATFVVERLIDLAAMQLGLDPVEIRRRNFVAADAFPYQTQVALQYDSGDYEATLDRALEISGYDDLRAEQTRRRESGEKPLGIGFSTYIEACGLAPSQVVGALGAQAGLWEAAKVRVHPSGSVTVYVGTQSQGQGHKTTYAQIVADRLGIDLDSIDVREGDTAEVQFGMGTYGSRSAAVGGSAVVEGVEKLIAKGREIAAHLMEASADDLVFEEGRYFVRGGDPSAGQSFGEVALQAYLAHNLPEGVEPGLEETAFYDPSNFTFPFGSHVAVVEVDPDTGEIEILRYIAVDDCGNVINPMIVDGQVQGGIVHGIGQALWEEALYDESGQMVSATLLDYALPRAHKVISMELDRTTTPCPHNPLGVKGIGEAGAIASPVALVNAVVDALRPYGIRHLEMPLTPEKIWREMHSGEES
jgi:carbon-monoxide dehydrogenase large subunit